MVTRITGRTLQAIRKRHLSAQPLCVVCDKAGRVTLAQELDHIIALCNGGTNDDDNLQPLCKACHTDKTRTDKGQIARATYGQDARVRW